MRKFSTILSVLAICLVFGFGTVMAAPTLSIGDFSILEGEQITVDVSLSNSADAGGVIDGFNFRVSFDSTGLAAANATSDVPLFTALGGASITNGTVSYIYDGFGVANLGDGVLGSFDVTGLALGNYPLILSDAVLTVGFDSITPDLVDGNVSVVPIPGSILLLGSGLVGLIGIARRKMSS